MSLDSRSNKKIFASSNTRSTYQKLLALFAGSILPWSFAPSDYYWLSIASPAILLLLWHKYPKYTFINGFLFGCGFFGCSVFWIYISIHTYGNASPFLAGLITAIFIAYLALFPATQGLLYRYIPCTNNAGKFLFTFPLSWIICEYLRGTLFTGFPWLFLGYSQINTPLKNFAPIGGIYLLSFLTAFIAGGIVYLWYTRNYIRRLIVALTILGLWLGAIAAGKILWDRPVGKPMSVALIQGNIPLEIRWQKDQLTNTLDTYYQLTKKSLNKNIIVWSEGAIPSASSAVQNFTNKLSYLAQKYHTTILAGTFVTAQNQTYNAFISFGANSNIYLKRHLVPFGEYLPLKNISGTLLKFFDIPMSDLSRGNNRQPPFIIDGITIAPFICYEITYPNLVTEYLPQAELLITVSEDSWFGKSYAARQHLEMARMRSLETGRDQLMVTNTGITAIIDHRGNIVAKAPSFQTAVLTGVVQPREGTTPYVKWKNYIRSLFRTK